MLAAEDLVVAKVYGLTVSVALPVTVLPVVGTVAVIVTVVVVVKFCAVTISCVPSALSAKVIPLLGLGFAVQVAEAVTF